VGKVKIAVIGGGISGLGAAAILSQKHEVHLFEASERLGGHAHTIYCKEGDQKIPLDTGFLVYNELTYPHLTAMFEWLRVETAPSDMSLSISVPQKQLEWSGTNLNTTFAQRKNLFKPSFLKMLLEILKFHRRAEKELALAKRHAWTLEELLRNRGYSQCFRDDYLIPMGAAIWSTPEHDMFQYPAATFLAFFLNHKLLQVNDRPMWKTVKNGSIEYVEKMKERIGQIHLASPVEQVQRSDGQVIVSALGRDITFDKVVFATHAPVTKKILKQQSLEEENFLSAFHVEPNTGVVHRDKNCMPKNKKCWSSWNVFTNNKKISLSYYLNRLQPLATSVDYFLSLNPPDELSGVEGEFKYDHPKFDQSTIRAQRLLPDLQGRGGIFFAGAWTRYGFHEDGLLSAVKVCALLGCNPPWTLK
jgi:uncharacterized protein